MEEIRKEMLKLILDHADKRILEHTKIGGTDLEIVRDTQKEIGELCTQVSANEWSYDALEAKLSHH